MMQKGEVVQTTEGFLCCLIPYSESDYIRNITGLMRTSAYANWRRIRFLLCEKGVPPESSLVATYFQDDSHIDFGIIVTLERHVFHFEFSWTGNDILNGTFRMWREATDLTQEMWPRYVSLALQLIGEDRKMLNGK